METLNNITVNSEDWVDLYEDKILSDAGIDNTMDIEIQIIQGDLMLRSSLTKPTNDSGFIPLLSNSFKPNPIATHNAENSQGAYVKAIGKSTTINVRRV